MTTKYTIQTLRSQFPDDDACLDYLFNARWPNGVTCAKCQRITKHHRITGKRVYSCQFCGTQVSPTADTIFHKSDTPLTSWFHAMFLLASTRTGISAKTLERELGVTYKTAWRMFTQIRKLMAQDSTLLFGGVEVDETYIGGRTKGDKRGRGAEHKTIVFGMVEREGKRAVLQVTPDVKAKTLLPIIQEHIPVTGTTTIFSDELRSYSRLTMMGYKHETVQHAAEEYVRGTAHTNNIENVWSNIKRGMDGAHHSVGPQHLQSYLDAYVFRYNHRKADMPMFNLILNEVPRHLSGTGTAS